MRVISFVNLKGGVGKTLTTINTAAILAKIHGKSVLVIDADSQCNTTEFFGLGDKKITLADALCEKSPDIETVGSAVGFSPYHDIMVLPASDRLMDLDLTKVREQKVNIECLVNLRKAYEDAPMIFIKTPEIILIDCPPAFNAASTAALLASDEVIIPIKLDAFSLRGMANLTRQIENMREINPGLRLSGLLPTMYYKSDKIAEAEKLLRNSGLPVYPHIRRTPKADDSTFAGMPLIESSPTCAAAKDYRRFVEELLKGGEQNG